ncbi:MAG: hypothetical protein AAF772_11725 [Acidobacteriota bacterium]
MGYQHMRTPIDELLNRWEQGEIDAEAVWYAAEDLWDTVDLLYIDFPDDHPDSPILEVLHDLSILNHQLIVREDIPALKKFLHAKPGSTVAAWQAYRAYLDSIDYQKRRDDLCDDDVYFPRQATDPDT